MTFLSSNDCSALGNDKCPVQQRRSSSEMKGKTSVWKSKRHACWALDLSRWDVNRSRSARALRRPSKVAEALDLVWWLERPRDGRLLTMHSAWTACMQLLLQRGWAVRLLYHTSTSRLPRFRHNQHDGTCHDSRTSEYVEIFMATYKSYVSRYLLALKVLITNTAQYDCSKKFKK